MGLEERLIRWIFGSTQVPAAIENKQTKFDIGINGSSDITRFIVQDDDGVQHIFITKDEIEVLIANGTISAGASVYILSTTETHCRALLSSLPIHNIWYEGPAFVDGANIDVISSKNIYGADNKSFQLGAELNLEYPTSGAANDIKIRFFNGIYSPSGYHAVTSGGYSGNGGFEYIAQTTSATSNVVSSTNVPFEYELNENITDQSNATLNLWSGLNVSGRLNDETVVNQSPADDADQSRELTVTKSGTSEGVELYERIVENKYGGNYFQKFKEFFIGGGTGGIGYLGNWGIDIKSTTSLALLCLDTGKSILGIGTQTYPWGIAAIDLGVDGWSAYTIDPRVSGTCNNAYWEPSGGWRAKSTGFCQRIEFEANGDKVEYTSASTTFDSIIAWLETKRTDQKGNIAYNGATIQPNLSLDYIHEFYKTKTIMTHKTIGQEFICCNCWRDDTSTYFSLTDSHYATYLLKDTITPKLESRRSTVVSAVVGQTMLITTTLPLS